MKARVRTAWLISAVVGVLLAGCSTIGVEEEPTATEGEQIRDVVLVTHESFALPKQLVKAWEKETGHKLVTRAAGDAGALTNKLVLTKDSPTGDVAFGVDNTFASRALEAGVFAEYGGELPAGADAYALGAEGSERLVPVDSGNVCVNVDTAWFAAHDQEPPATLADLTEPAYRDLFVAPGAPTSSPGFAFLLATIAEYGDGWQDYWADLMANGTKLTSGWEDAYFVDFTGGGGKNASRPIVVSYDSSPAFTVDTKTGESTTAALLETCFRQVEYAGVLEGANNPEGARGLIEFLLSEEVQAALPESMFVFPVRDGVELPADWAKHAVRPERTLEVSPEDIDAHRDEWLTEWTDITTR